MQQMVPASGYDRAITIFSPEGRLYQVEYAREAVRRGTTAVGIKCKDGVVLAVDRRITSKLIDVSSIEKIFQIDDHIVAATSGLVADARVLIDRARLEAQMNRISYGEAITVEALAKKICDIKQAYTQHGGARPFGLALLITGIDRHSARLFETDPSGALIEYKATAIGSGRPIAMEVLESKYDENMTVNEGMELALYALSKTTEELKPENIDMAIVKDSGKLVEKISVDEIEKIVKAVYKKVEAEEAEAEKNKGEEDIE
ncbi:archaeal proteasome endopeptidase complex subunit alpha [Methanococcus maripaludis]|uniref:Proteasome subunit alpha n=2 Tax=Methanococcus maripaludis TaxID=39152 RepID=PSA_METM7|nr:archaeal proteasome endopeptidase complex subunit alpha [Methanococcus maripaludis]A6VIP0.1 RecName: Full=Proteasome subunit alpha; AltName: Full=20S proteasome alpha subunit; AltName: Full=Proteasome core protein PsmA [Methanococcus maripaludis C7]MBA2862412.1 proteasome alpha subunit [Methanococcus maripaludis]